jgi:hypothetical protein
MKSEPSGEGQAREQHAERQGRALTEGGDDVAGIHGILVFDEAEAVHQLDLGDLTGAVGLEVTFDLGLCGIARQVAQVETRRRDLSHGGVGAESGGGPSLERDVSARRRRRGPVSGMGHGTPLRGRDDRVRLELGLGRELGLGTETETETGTGPDEASAAASRTFGLSGGGGAEGPAGGGGLEGIPEGSRVGDGSRQVRARWRAAAVIRRARAVESTGRETSEGWGEAALRQHARRCLAPSRAAANVKLQH